MFVTIDEFYTPEFYNQTKEAMKNNFVEPKEFISIKAPYLWYFKVDTHPYMLNYEELPKTQERFLINKVQALRSNEEYKLIRRNDAKGQKALQRYTENEPLKEARTSDYAVFFNAKSKEQLQEITKELPVRLWYMGRYYKKYKVVLCTNKMILNYISKDDILLEREKSQLKEVGRFEAELNYKAFRGYDMLEKYTETPYIENGIFYQPSFKGDREVSTRFVI